MTPALLFLALKEHVIPVLEGPQELGQLGRKGELVPVDSLASALRLRPSAWWGRSTDATCGLGTPPLIPTDFSLVDALEPGSPIPGTAIGRAPGEEPDFRGLQRQARAQLQDLATLPPELRDPLLGALQELLQDPWALQELEDTLEQALDTGVLGQLGGPGGLILSILRDPSGSLSPSKARAILCILGALVVLSDTQHCLLAQCLERGVLPQRLELVASILEPNFNQLEETTFSLPLEVLSFLQREDVALTRSLVEGCELEPQGPGRQLTWDPGMVPQLSALYVSLAGLQLLAAPGPAAVQADA